MKLSCIIFLLIVFFIACNPLNDTEKITNIICPVDSTLFVVIKQNSIGFNKNSATKYPYFYYVFYKNKTFYKLIKPKNELKRVNDTLNDIVPYNVWNVEDDSIIKLNNGKYKVALIESKKITLILLNKKLDTLIIEKIFPKQ